MFSYRRKFVFARQKVFYKSAYLRRSKKRSSIYPVGQLYDRICGNVQKIANENDGKVIVIVTHATPIRALCCKAQGLPVEQMKDVPWVSNASLTIMQVDGEKFRLVKKDVCEYLSDLQTRFPANV